MSLGGMYINRKGFKSLNTLVVTDWNQNIVHIYPVWPGAACDITVWKHSPLCKALLRNKNDILPSMLYYFFDI